MSENLIIYFESHENDQEMEDILSSKSKIKKIIVKELQEVSEKYGKDRKTEIVYASDLEDEEDMKEEIPDYPVFLFFTKEGYFKKIQPNSWLKSGEHKLKEGDKVVFEMETTNNTDLLFFTNKNQVYKSNANDFDDTKSSNRRFCRLTSWNGRRRNGNIYGGNKRLFRIYAFLL